MSISIELYEQIKAELSAAKAEIYHLTTERDEWHLRAEKAEVERLREMRADFNNELQEMSERFRAVNLAECAKLYDKDVQRERDNALAEIERLRMAIQTAINPAAEREASRRRGVWMPDPTEGNPPYPPPAREG